MSPTERAEFDEMKRIVASLQKVEDVPFIENVKRRLGFGSVTAESGASTTGTSIAVRNSAGDGTTTVPTEYSGVLTLSDTQGNSYRIGFYS